MLLGLFLYPVFMTEAMPTRHAGDRSFQRDLNRKSVQHVVKHGVVTPQDNGMLKHVGRHRDDIDHEYTVITTPQKQIVTAWKNHSPYERVLSAQRADATKSGEAKASADTSRRRQKEALERKRAKSAASSNKQPKGKKP